MYHRQLAKLTQLHWMSHIRGYLDAQQDELKVRLPSPVQFVLTSYVGGVWTAKRVPYYALDVRPKELSDATGESLNTWMYSGQLVAVVGGKTGEETDIMSAAHEAAGEMFVRDHLHLPANSSKFKLLAFAQTDMDFSGAIQVVKDPTKPFWIQSFRIGISWLVSEDAPRQHDEDA